MNSDARTVGNYSSGKNPGSTLSIMGTRYTNNYFGRGNYGQTVHCSGHIAIKGCGRTPFHRGADGGHAVVFRKFRGDEIPCTI
jgi:hypothetical protein